VCNRIYIISAICLNGFDNFSLSVLISKSYLVVCLSIYRLSHIWQRHHVLLEKCEEIKQPLVPISVNSAIHRANCLSSLGETSLRVLIVDDEPDITRNLKLGLEKAGFYVDVYNSPWQALDNFKPGYYQRIIADIRMPTMNGFEFARAIWAKDANADICFLSAFEMYEQAAKKVFAHLKDYCFIKKPIRPSDLVKHIRSHI
jgi:CheY-like chemotaxis protein